MNNNFPLIAVIDSGIGGISVLKKMINQNNGGNYLYFADNLFMPYGNLKREFLKQRLEVIIDFLFENRKVDFVVVACNTASSCLDDTQQNVFKLCFDANKSYLATPLTSRNNKTLNMLSDASLAQIIDKYYLNKTKLKRYVSKHLKKITESNTKSLTLACTHFELIHEMLAEFLPNIDFTDNSNYLLEQLPRFDFRGETNVCFEMSRNSQTYKLKLRQILKDT